MNIVILAAGMGKRMHSDLPKVLHPLAGKPLLGHVLDAAISLRPGKLVVVHGHGGDKVRAAFERHREQKQSESEATGNVDANADADANAKAKADSDSFGPAIDWALQSPQLGTGHAVAQAVEFLDDDQPTLILYGDVPLVGHATLQRLAQATDGGRCVALLTQVMSDPSGYGRIVRKDGRVVKIVEQKDADAATLRVPEINTGILIAPTRELKAWLAGLQNDNAQGEYYLTDIIAAAVRDGVDVNTVHPSALWETLGVNSKTQLAELERQHQRNLALELTESGVTLADPARIDIRGRLQCGRDVVIDVGCVFEGHVSLGDRVRIGPNCVIRDAIIDDDAEILAMSHIQGAQVGSRSRVGPFARLRPGTDLGEDNHVGNFVEFKNTRMAAGSKANHLAYVGDARIGERVNIGAGTITCNYDGANKYETVIEDDVFIGSDSQLVAPVTVRRGATIGAGTTLTREAPPDALTISRTKQMTVTEWKRPVKKR